MPHKLEGLLLKAEHPVAIMGTVETGDFELIDLQGLQPLTPEEIRSRYTSRGWYYVGSVGIVDGTPQSALEEPLDEAAVQSLAAAYLRHIEQRLDAKLGVAMLEQMFAN